MFTGPSNLTLTVSWPVFLKSKLFHRETATLGTWKKNRVVSADFAEVEFVREYHYW